MKRVFVFCVVLALILPVLAVGACAVTEYVFTPADEGGDLVLEGALPEGLYKISFVRDGASEFVVYDKFYVSFYPDSDCDVCCIPLFFTTSSGETSISVFYIEQYSDCCYVNFPSGTMNGSMVFTPLDTGIGAVYDGVSAFSTVLDALFSLIINNPLLAAFCAASLIGVGVVVYRSVKASVR